LQHRSKCTSSLCIAYATVDKMHGEIQKASRTKGGVHRLPKGFLAPSDEKKVYAFFAALTPFLTTSLLAFLATRVLNLSKSLSDFRFSMAALLVAHVDLFHFSTIPSVDSCLRTVPEPALRGSFDRRNGVRVRCRYGKAWRGTPVGGPSTMAYRKIREGAMSECGFATHPVVVDNLSNDGGLASMGSRSEEDNWKIGHHGKSRLPISPRRSVRRYTSPDLDKSFEV